MVAACWSACCLGALQFDLRASDGTANSYAIDCQSTASAYAASALVYPGAAAGDLWVLRTPRLTVPAGTTSLRARLVYGGYAGGTIDMAVKIGAMSVRTVG